MFGGVGGAGVAWLLDILVWYVYDGFWMILVGYLIVPVLDFAIVHVCWGLMLLLHCFSHVCFIPSFSQIYSFAGHV